MDKRCLFLTSDGLPDRARSIFFDVIGKEPGQIKVLYIPTAGFESDGGRESFALCLDQLAAMGICQDNVFIYNLELLLSKGYVRTYSAHVAVPAMVSRLLTVDEVMTFDAVFVSGGESTVLSREMVRTGFDEVLSAAIDRGIVYVGLSAGSMYAAGNLKNGLHIIPNPIIPHWDGTGEIFLPAGNGEIRLADGQAILIRDEKVEIIR